MRERERPKISINANKQQGSRSCRCKASRIRHIQHTAYISGFRDLRDLTNEVRAYGPRGETTAKKKTGRRQKDEEASAEDSWSLSAKRTKAAGVLAPSEIYFLFRDERALHFVVRAAKESTKIFPPMTLCYICYNCAGDRSISHRRMTVEAWIRSRETKGESMKDHSFRGLVKSSPLKNSILRTIAGSVTKSSSINHSLCPLQRSNDKSLNCHSGRLICHYEKIGGLL